MTEDRKLLRDACADFLSTRQTVMLATADRQGVPDASYAPYLFHQGDFYLLLSLLAPHTHNLMETGRASLLFVEDESRAGQPFARRRLSFRCEAEPVSRDCDDHSVILSRFRHRFGSIIEILANLDDFRLFRLRPYQCRYVQGFGQVHDFDKPQLIDLEHLQDG